MELFGKHKVTFDILRSLAIQCHALDLGAYDLFLDSTHTDRDNKTKSTYEELFTSKLLSLAIGLRTKFYQGIDPRSTIPYVSSNFLYDCELKPEASLEFSMKDICDKIIHADNINRFMESGVEKPTTNLSGKNKDKSDWKLSISVSLFAEAILNWIQDIEPAS